MSKSVMELKWTDAECEAVANRMSEVLRKEPELTKLRAVRKAQECLPLSRQGFISAWPLIETRLLPFLTQPSSASAPHPQLSPSRVSTFKQVSALVAKEVADLRRKQAVVKAVAKPRQLELGFSASQEAFTQARQTEPSVQVQTKEASVPPQAAVAPVMKQVTPPAGTRLESSLSAEDIQARIALRSVVRKDRIQQELSKLMEAGVLAGFSDRAGFSPRRHG